MHAVTCLEDGINTCERCENCETLPAWIGLEKVVNTYLSSVTLQQLADQALESKRIRDALKEMKEVDKPDGSAVKA